MKLEACCASVRSSSPYFAAASACKWFNGSEMRLPQPVRYSSRQQYVHIHGAHARTAGMASSVERCWPFKLLYPWFTVIFFANHMQFSLRFAVRLSAGSGISLQTLPRLLDQK